jgi:hypothetical protein
VVPATIAAVADEVPTAETVASSVAWELLFTNEAAIIPATLPGGGKLAIIE